MKKNLIYYHLYPGKDLYLENFQHFLSFGYTDKDDYCIIIAGECEHKLPEAKNIKYIFSENKNNDFGGYCAAIGHLPDLKNYEYVFFINSSVRGPFLSPGSMHTWVDKFIELFDPGTGLVGSTICILNKDNYHAKRYINKWGGESATHVQSTAYAMHVSTYIYLIDAGFYCNKQWLTKDDVIEDYEIRLSQQILKMGLNLKCVLPVYNKINYLVPHQDINPTSKNGDPCLINAFFGRNIHPLEGIFVKSNRKVYAKNYLNLLAKSMLINYDKNYPLLRSSFILEYHQKLHGLVNGDDENFEYDVVLPGKLKSKIKELNIKLFNLHQCEAKNNQIIQYQENLINRLLNCNSYKITRPLRLLKSFFIK